MTEVIIGDVKKFAVRLKLEVRDGEFVSGQVCYVIGNTQWGCFEEKTLLTDFITASSDASRLCGDNFSQQLWDMGPNEAFYAIYRSIYMESDEIADAGNFDITPNISPFDDVFIFEVKNGKYSRFICRNGSEEIRSIDLYEVSVNGVLVEVWRTISQYN
ncbi:Imm42 family immunity protein [Caulobacter sp. Root1472]|uniref:Imm42 family immunity protein n=1 Tax=Caulobacter sp. Root1472 TaxID=1736470 RepID=UPI00138F6729|nr:Imm42 family immunity protein [Caulobacter sp. Root1472]